MKILPLFPKKKESVPVLLSAPPPGTERAIVDMLILVKVAAGTVHQVVVSSDQYGAIFSLLQKTGGVQIVEQPVPFDWKREP